jgi:SepF-like predicted cell division protein (DUF552 family)
MFLFKKTVIRALSGVVSLGFFDKVMKKEPGVDLDDFLNNLDQVQEESYENADALVKPLELGTEVDAEAVVREVKQGNIVLANIADLNKRNKAKLKELLSRVKAEVKAIDGDMAGISAERVLVTPAKVKIIKKKI